MNKNIIDKLVKYGLITNIEVDADKYESIDDLINKGIITIPGIKQKIIELIGEESEQNVETVTVIEPEKGPETEPATTVIEPEKKPEAPEYVYYYSEENIFNKMNFSYNLYRRNYKY